MCFAIFIFIVLICAIELKYKTIDSVYEVDQKSGFAYCFYIKIV